MTFPLDYSFPPSAAGDDAGLVKCSELADLSWSVFTIKLCKFTMSALCSICQSRALPRAHLCSSTLLEANSYIANPAELPIVIESIAYDMYLLPLNRFPSLLVVTLSLVRLFDDPVGYCLGWCIYDPKKNITMGKVSEPGTLNPPALPTTILPGEIKPIKVQLDGAPPFTRGIDDVVIAAHSPR